jgi:hypothetical protein
MRRGFIFGLLCIWIATTGSTCQSSFTSGSFQAQGEGAGVVLVVLVAAGVSCLASEYGCRARPPGPFDQVQETFESGVAQIENGTPAGMDLVCLAAHQGYAKAQYYYGVHLFRQDPTNSVESLAWLKRAAAQDNKAARFMVAQMTDWRLPFRRRRCGPAWTARAPRPWSWKPWAPGAMCRGEHSWVAPPYLPS